ncbi:hypothetical protein Goshw_026949 [Gossypium schwendimanii]|uniref:DUF7745 domain-containing protein n=2 Tax=Gossypium TaxID=3633 RepID=A0A7J9LRY3_GOSSC|nr:hypothetical protein [Gossypium schwendimanii]
MEKRFLDKVEDSAAVRIWSDKTQQEKDLVPTVEEYTTLLYCPMIQADKAYSRAANVSTFLKKLMSITWMSEQWVHLDTKKRVDIFALSIYGLTIFPKVLRHIDEVVSNLFDRLDKRVMAVLPLLKVEKVSYRVFSENYSLLKELVATPRRDNISEEKWMVILQGLQDKDVEWNAPWMISNEILYRCRDFDWVPLLEIYRAIGYAPLLVLRQYRSSQFIPARQGLAQCEFAYKSDNYKKKTSEQWRQEIKEEKIRVDQWENKFQATQVRENTLKRDLLESRNEKLKEKIKEFEATLQNCELRVEFLEMNNEHWKEQLQRSQGKIRDRDHIMGEVVTQVREAADHL